MQTWFQVQCWFRVSFFPGCSMTQLAPQQQSLTTSSASVGAFICTQTWPVVSVVLRFFWPTNKHGSHKDVFARWPWNLNSSWWSTKCFCVCPSAVQRSWLKIRHRLLTDPLFCCIKKNMQIQWWYLTGCTVYCVFCFLIARCVACFLAVCSWALDWLS